MRQRAMAQRSFADVRRMTVRGALIVAEIALAVVLLVGSGLMVQSLPRPATVLRDG